MDPFIGQIIMFGGNFAPRAWAFCNGQLLSIAQNTALFSILGTTYGGDGRTTFALPDMRGRVAIHSGGSTGPGLSPYQLGQRGGTQTVNLSVLQMPSHNHLAAFTPSGGGSAAKVEVSTADGGSREPSTGAYLGRTNQGALGNNLYVTSPAASTLVELGGVSGGGGGGGTVAIGLTGGSQAHTNIQPFLAINYIIALQGTFPSRN